MVNYDSLSALYYDISKPVGFSLDKDLEFYRERVKSSKRILEVGVGTGRILIPLLKEGLHIEGVDRSLAMVEICMKNLKVHKLSTDLIVADVSHYKFERYDAIIIPSGTIGMFQDVKKVLENLYNSLTDDGFLLFDLVLPYDFIENESFTYGVWVNDSTELLLHDHRKTMDWLNQKTSQEFVYELIEDGVVIDREIQEFTTYWYGTEEMRLILKDIGYKNIELFKDYKAVDEKPEFISLSIKARR